MPIYCGQVAQLVLSRDTDSAPSARRRILGEFDISSGAVDNMLGAFPRKMGKCDRGRCISQSPTAVPASRVGDILQFPVSAGDLIARLDRNPPFS